MTDPDLLALAGRLDEWMEDTKRSHAVSRGYESQQHVEDVEDSAAAVRALDRLVKAVEAHRAANTSNCNDLSCPKGCGHDLRLYAVLDEQRSD